MNVWESIEMPDNRRRASRLLNWKFERLRKAGQFDCQFRCAAQENV